MTMADDTPTTPPGLAQPIHARAVRSGFHFWKIIVMGLLVFGYAGLAFLYDGFVRYPAINARIAAINAQVNEPTIDEGARADLTREVKNLTEHKPLDLTIQRVVGLVCVPLGLFIIYRHLRTVRGEYLLADDVLSLPDGRTIPIDAITAAHNAKWESKAIATFDYRLPDGAAGDFKLDALAFETKPTDAIHDAILARVPKST